MEPAQMLAQLTADAAGLRAAARDLDPAVPTCPGWTVRDAVEHTAVVYAHKSAVLDGSIATMTEWPPPELDRSNPLELFDEQLHRLVEELRRRDPQATVWTWFEADQTVAFWVRRMMHETVIHRADVESAFGPLSSVPPEVAVDGIDELVERFLCYWDEEYAAAPGHGERVVISTDGVAWTVTLRPDGARFERGSSDDADARISGEPSDLLLALWNRLPYDAVTASGDPAAVAALRAALVATTQ